MVILGEKSKARNFSYLVYTRLKGFKMLPIRPNILIIAIAITGICAGIIWLIGKALTGTDVNEVVLGVLIGLLGTGITSLAGLVANGSKSS